jgi:hypothetical protein
MAPTLYAHLPGLKLREGDAPFAGGLLRRLPFDEWVSLESEYQWADSKYERARPTFWIRELASDVSEASEAIKDAVSTALWPVHAAFLLDHQAPLLPNPLLSSCYVCTDPPPEYSDIVRSSVLRQIGPMERELIVYGDPLTYTYGAADLAGVERRLQFVEANHLRDLNDDIGAGIRVLEETARPDSWYGGDQVICQLHGFVRCMAACESLLLAQIDEGEKVEITQTFGRNAAVLFTASAEQKERAEKQFVELYRLRTQLIHGRASAVGADAETIKKLTQGRRLLRNIIMAALLLRVRDCDRAPLWQLLQQCWNDPERHARLAQTMTELRSL